MNSLLYLSLLTIHFSLQELYENEFPFMIVKSYKDKGYHRITNSTANLPEKLMVGPYRFRFITESNCNYLKSDNYCYRFLDVSGPVLKYDNLIELAACMGQVEDNWIKCLYHIAEMGTMPLYMFELYENDKSTNNYYIKLGVFDWKNTLLEGYYANKNLRYFGTFSQSMFNGVNEKCISNSEGKDCIYNGSCQNKQIVLEIKNDSFFIWENRMLEVKSICSNHISWMDDYNLCVWRNYTWADLFLRFLHVKPLCNTTFFPVDFTPSAAPENDTSTTQFQITLSDSMSTERSTKVDGTNFEGANRTKDHPKDRNNTMSWRLGFIACTLFADFLIKIFLYFLGYRDFGFLSNFSKGIVIIIILMDFFVKSAVLVVMFI